MREPKSASSIRFHYQQPARFPVRLLRDRLAMLFRKHKKASFTVNYIFCSDKELLRINKSYLGHDYYTDIITFDLSDSTAHLRADIYISAGRVRDNAQKLGFPIYKELARVILHGALHLVGYSDKTAREKKEMRKAEDRLLKELFKNVPRETKAKRIQKGGFM